MGITLAYAVRMFANILVTALFVRAILSWFVSDMYSPVGKLYGLLIRFTEPLVQPCRNFLSRFNTGIIDFSLFLAMILIEIGANILVRIILMFM